MIVGTGLAEPEPLEKFNWLMHLQHVRGEVGASKQLIAKEIAKSQGRHEYAYFKQVKCCGGFV